MWERYYAFHIHCDGIGRDGRDATLNFSTGGQLRNFGGGVYWTLVQCIQSRNKGKGIGEIAKWPKYSVAGDAASLPVRESRYNCIDGAPAECCSRLEISFP